MLEVSDVEPSSKYEGEYNKLLHSGERYGLFRSRRTFIKSILIFDLATILGIIQQERFIDF
jgi:hypothetical protein